MNKEKLFATRLKTLRKQLKLTQKIVALELGLGQSAIANYEKGTRFPDEKTLRKIAKYFNTSLDYLMDINDDLETTNISIDFNNIKSEYKKIMTSDKYKLGLSYILTLQKKGVSLLDIFQEVIIPTLTFTGELWERSIISIAQEHLITEEIEKTIDIVSHFYKSKGSKNIRCVCVTPGIEKHKIPLKMISELLQLEGYQVSFLGINTPTNNVIDYCKSVKPDFVIISAIMDISLDAVNNIISGLKSRDCKVIVGGAAFNRNPKAWKILNADYLGKTIKETISIVNHHHQFHQ